MDDPRFNVRIEAVIAVARHGPDQRLIDALAEVLNGPEPALSTVAAWALGRMGDARAVEPLRQAVQSSKYRSVRAHSIRSLGVLGDLESVPLFWSGVAEESDVGMLLAYSSVLGRMQVTEATSQLLALLANSPSRSSRREMALALARLVGDENNFVSLLRQCDQEAGTPMAQAMLALRKRLEKGEGDTLASARWISAPRRWPGRKWSRESAQLAEAISLLPAERPGAPRRWRLLEETALRMQQFGVQRMEYPISGAARADVAWEA